MNAVAQDDWQEQADDPRICIDGRIDPAREDRYWQGAFWAEPYYRDDRNYDDYAPAYCVGYIGYAQYGGCFEDAEKSLCANWLRIKGDSRLELEEALRAIRAAWDRAAQPARQPEEEEDEEPVEAEFVPAAASPQPAYALA